MAQCSHPYDAMAKDVARSNRVLSFVLTYLLFHMDVMLSVAVRAIAKRLVTSVLQLHSFVILDPRYTNSSTSLILSPIYHEISVIKPVVINYHDLSLFLHSGGALWVDSLLSLRRSFAAVLLC